MELDKFPVVQMEPTRMTIHAHIYQQMDTLEVGEAIALPLFEYAAVARDFTLPQCHRLAYKKFGMKANRHASAIYIYRKE